MEKLIALSPMLARVIMGAFFWSMAFGLIKDFRVVTGMMQAKGVPFQAPLLSVTILVWVLGGAALVFGKFVAPGAILLLLLTVAVTPVMHNFWAAEPAMMPNELQHFLKNIAIAAGLLAIIGLSEH